MKTSYDTSDFILRRKVTLRYLIWPWEIDNLKEIVGKFIFQSTG